MVLEVDGERLKVLPESLDQFFDDHPMLCMRNAHLTALPPIPLQRDGVLFLTQRRQATSDIRENPSVRILGSHAAMTCHILIMRHTFSHVGSLGHFDNFSCWQFGDENSAHTEGIKTMVEEVKHLSADDFSKGRIKVSVFGGYADERGDGMRNSMSLIKALSDSETRFECNHFCTGRFNTKKGTDGKNTAILVGIALDLKSQTIFHASFPWNNFEDFSTQLQDRFLRRTGQGSILSDDEYYKTKKSTFKPKALRNPNTYKNLQKSQEDYKKSDPPGHTVNFANVLKSSVDN